MPKEQTKPVHIYPFGTAQIVFLGKEDYATDIYYVRRKVRWAWSDDVQYEEDGVKYFIGVDLTIKRVELFAPEPAGWEQKYTPGYLRVEVASLLDKRERDAK